MSRKLYVALALVVTAVMFLSACATPTPQNVCL